MNGGLVKEKDKIARSTTACKANSIETLQRQALKWNAIPILFVNSVRIWFYICIKLIKIHHKHENVSCVSVFDRVVDLCIHSRCNVWSAPYFHTDTEIFCVWIVHCGYCILSHTIDMGIAHLKWEGKICLNCVDWRHDMTLINKTKTDVRVST